MGSGIFRIGFLKFGAPLASHTNPTDCTKTWEKHGVITKRTVVSSPKEQWCQLNGRYSCVDLVLILHRQNQYHILQVSKMRTPPKTTLESNSVLAHKIRSGTNTNKTLAFSFLKQKKLFRSKKFSTMAPPPAKPKATAAHSQ